MTVRVRQLVRTTSAAPIPPPTPIMEFVQEPTDTSINTLFVPTVTVQISDGASDSLTISSPTCDISPVTVTADASGLAIFAGLMTGPTPSPACVLVVHNNSRTAIADITSTPFAIVQLTPVLTWTILDTISVQNTIDIGPFDSTGANAIVIAASVDWLDSSAPFSWNDSQGNAYAALTPPAGNPPASNQPAIRLYYNPNPNTSPTHTLTWAWYATPIRNISVVLLQGSGTNLFDSFANGFIFANVTSIAPSAPVPIDFPGSIVITTARSNNGGLTTPAGYSTLYLDGSNGVAYRLPDEGSIETPLWTFNVSVAAMSMVVLRTQ